MGRKGVNAEMGEEEEQGQEGERWRGERVAKGSVLLDSTYCSIVSGLLRLFRQRFLLLLL
jgi:hypothetical protein